MAAILSKQRAETLSSVLYPDDRTYEGKELRLKQQHFFVSATLQVRGRIHWRGLCNLSHWGFAPPRMECSVARSHQNPHMIPYVNIHTYLLNGGPQDVLRRFTDAHPGNWELFPSKVAFQLNDTHPTIAVAELMRLLMDEHSLGWTKAWDICTKVGLEGE